MENPSEKDCKDSNESQVCSPVSTVINAPRFGFVIPNRVFVGGISSQTTENDLAQLFSSYGNVLNTKIISDRAGVSKGYGFVTFETEEEAKRLQADAESIVLRERRLNIAPAIKKQNFQPRTYEGLPPVPGSPVSMTTGQLYRQTGVPFFQNGMAFYTPAPAPQPQPMAPVQSPVEAPQVYPPGAYGGMPQTSSAQNFTFSYPAQNHVYYPAHYPYQLALEGYPMTDVLIPAGGGADNGGVVFAPPYIFTQQPGPQQNAFFDPQNISQFSQTQEPIFYSASRGYETPTLLYTERQPPQPGTPSGAGTLDNRGEGYSGNQEAPVVPLHTNLENGNTFASRPRGKTYVSRRGYNKPPSRYPLNNNDPNHTNHNSNPIPNRTTRSYPTRSYKPTPNRTFPPSLSNRFLGQHGSSHNKPSPVQVPQFPYISSVRPPPYAMQPISPHFSSPRRGLFRPRYQNGRGKPPKGTGWYKERDEHVTEEGNALANALTPPITPRSPHDTAEELASSLQSLNI